MKRIISMLLVLCLLVGLSTQALAARETEVRLPEVTLEDSILQSDVFYLASTSAEIEEGGHSIYLLRVGRGGDAESEATALIKIADVTAK